MIQHDRFSIILFLCLFLIVSIAVPQNNDTPYVAGNGVTNAVALAQPKPPYTEEARNARIQGRVKLQCIVRKNGTVDSCKVLKGLGSGLDESVINTIATKWRFKPGTKNGVPVDVIVNIEVVFSLDGQRLRYGPTDWIPPLPAAADERIIFANFESHITPSFSYGLPLPPNKQERSSRPIIGMLMEPKISSALKRVEIVIKKDSGDAALTGFLMSDNNGPCEVIESFTFEVLPEAASKPATVRASSSQHPMIEAKKRYWFVLARPEAPGRFFWYRHSGQAFTSIVLSADAAGPHHVRTGEPGFLLRLIGDAPTRN